MTMSKTMEKSITKPQGCDIHRIARQSGVKLTDGSQFYRTARDPGECFSPATMRRIGCAHGAGHLALVLRLVVETEGNAGELYSETMWSISELLHHRPDLLDRGVALFDAFDTVDLRAVRAAAKTLSCGLPVSHVMRVLLALQMDHYPTDEPASNVGPSQSGDRPAVPAE